MLLYGSDESLNSTPESVLTSWNLNKNRKKKKREWTCTLGIRAALIVQHTVLWFSSTYTCLSKEEQRGADSYKLQIK